MKKFTLLLISLLFLSSCTIDWNDEKDKKITELNNKLHGLENIRDKKNDILDSCRQKIHTFNYSPVHENSGSLYFFDGSGTLVTSFKKYDCSTNIESEVLSSHVFEEISTNLPTKNKNYRVGLYLDEEGSAFSINYNFLSFSYFPPCAEQCGDDNSHPYYHIRINLDSKDVLVERERQYEKQFTLSRL